MSKFTDIPYYIFKDISDDYIKRVNSSTSNIFILNHIIMRSFLDKTLDFKIKTSVDENYYIFNDFQFKMISYDDFIINLEYISGDENGYNDGDEIYIRKYSNIYYSISQKFLDSSVLNINKDYFYIGRIYSRNNENGYYITLSNLADFVIKALPEVNRTNEIKDFLTIAFDKTYAEIYQKQKNIWSIIDPFETDKDYLNNIAKMYNIIISNTFISTSTFNTRVFVNYLIDLLKRKGTYSSIYISSKLNVDNIIRIFERWHTKFWDGHDLPISKSEALSATDVINPLNYFMDFDYLNYYGMSTSSSLSGDRVVHSSGKYVASSSLINDDSLIHEQTISSKTWNIYHSFNTNNLIIQIYNSNFEMVYPKSIKASDRERIIVEFEEKTTGYIFAANSKSTNGPPTPSQLASWYLNHGLNTFYPVGYVSELNNETLGLTDEILTKAVPSDIVPLSSGNVLIENLENANNPIVDFTEGDSIIYYYKPSTTWTAEYGSEYQNMIIMPEFYIDYPQKEIEIVHNLESKNLIAKCISHDNKIIEPLSIKFNTDNKIMLSFASEFSGLISLNRSNKTISTSLSGSLSGDFVHNLDTKNIIIQAQNKNSTVIKINNIYLIDNNTARIVFNNPIDNCNVNFIYTENKYTTSVAASAWNVQHNLESIYPLIDVYNDNDEKIDINEIEYIDENNLTVKFNNDYTGYLVAKASDFYKKKVIKNLGPKTLTVGSNVVTAEWHIPVSGLCVLKEIGSTGYSETLLMSPHYKVQLDLNNNPYTSTTILSEPTIDLLYNTWENSRPASKYAHYEIYLEPLTNFTGNYISLYPETDDYAKFKTMFCENLVLESDCFIYTKNKSQASDEWIVSHNLNEDVIVQCFDQNKNEIIPENIEVVSYNILKIYFDEDVYGHAFVTSADDTFNKSGKDVTVTAEYVSNGVITQSYENNLNVKPEEIEIVDNNLNYSFDDSIESKILLKEANVKVVQSTYSKYWMVSHMLDAECVIIQFYNNNDERIYPKSVNISNINDAYASFSSMENGYAIVKKIGSILDMDYYLNKASYFKLGSGQSKENFNPININNIENPLLNSNDEEIKITPLSLTNESGSDYAYIQGTYGDLAESFDVYEVGVFDDEDNILFYSYFDVIHKLKNVDFKLNYKIKKIY